jgi:glycosyltransferase involved in cell wall biosynthesis
MKPDISIYFSGHNIDIYIKLAIESFLHHYSEYKDNIYFFDDCSTDKTQEYIKELGIKCITWDSQLKDQFNTYYENNYFASAGASSVMRCEFIFKNILMHANTKYIIILDGDTITLKRGFIENLLQDKIGLYMTDTPMHCNYNNYLNNHIGVQLYRDCIKSTKPSILRSTQEEVIYIHKASPYFICMNTTLTGDLKYLIDNLYNKDYVAAMDGSCIDVGTDLYAHMIRNDIPVEIFKDTYIHHWFWISSGIRDSEHGCCLSNDFLLIRLKDNLAKSKPALKTMKTLGYKPSEFIKFYKDHLRTEDYNEF